MYAPANDTNNTYAWNGLAFIVPGVGAPAGANTAPYCDNSYKGPNYSASGLPDSCLQMQFGSGGGNLDGMIYAPSAALYFQDNGGGTQVTGLIVDSLDVNSKLTITDSYPFAHPESPLNQVQLVE